MVYRVAGIIDQKSEVLEIALIQFEVTGKKWSYEIKASSLYPYEQDWKQKLSSIDSLSMTAFFELHKEYGHLLATYLLKFIEQHQLDYQVQLIASPGKKIQESIDFNLGDGGAIAALTGINTVSNFTSIDTALNGRNQNLVFEQINAVASETNAEMIYTCFFAVLRWREENNFFAENTGASRNSIGGAVWIGQEW